MPRSYSIEVRAARKVVEAAIRSSVKRETLCRAVGLDPALLDAPDHRMPFAKLVALYDSAARLARDDDFGLHLGELADPKKYDLLGYVAMNCQTFEGLLHSLICYLQIWTDAVTFSLETVGSRVSLSYLYRVPDLSAEQRRQESENMLSTIVQAARLMTGVDWSPGGVWFEHSKPKSVSEHKRIFRAALHFAAARTKLVFDASILKLPLLKADPRLGALLARQAQGRLGELPRDGTLVDEVRDAIGENSETNDLRLETVARKFKTTSRTLQRKLEEEGTSFQELVKERQRSLAKVYLRKEELAICEVAYLLGFSQPSAFHRAFQRWTGMTPQEFRRSRDPEAQNTKSKTRR